MRIALIGMGRMGQAVEAAAVARGWAVSHRVTAESAAALEAITAESTDVAIDFTQAAAVMGTLRQLLPRRVPVVVGTTGWLDQLPKAQALVAQHEGTLVVGANFSIGMNLLMQLNRALARWMNAHPSFDPYIEDRHHAGKADAPSGTALRLADDLMRQHPRKTTVVSAADLARRPPAPHELSVGAIRAGAIAGTHTVGWASPVESLELRHTAHSREGFAEGACYAAQWCVGKRGFYRFEDLFESL